MLLPLLLIALVKPATATDTETTQGTILGAVPEDAYALVHCQNVAALRARAEANDWYRLLGSDHGEPILSDLAGEFRRAFHGEMDTQLGVAQGLEGEVLFFDTGSVAGFVSAPPADRALLAERMRAWLPTGDAVAGRSLEIAGGQVELVGWPESGWSGRAGHFAAFVDHPQALALYSGDDSAVVLAALTEGLTGLGTDRRAPLVEAYLEAGGGNGGGVEAFVDFSPMVVRAEEALVDAAQDHLADPLRLLGLDRGTWLHATFDLYPGNTVDCRARLRLPPKTLSSELADTFQPLSATLPADLPRGVWALYAFHWDLGDFYQRVRAAYEEAGLEDQLRMVDAGVEAARGLAGVDPVADLLNNLDGEFAWWFVEPQGVSEDEPFTGSLDQTLSALGFHAGLVDGNAFITSLENLMELASLEWDEADGAELYLSGDDDFDGGLGVLPRSLSVGLKRAVLERSIAAINRADGASLEHGSRMQGAIDENAGACVLTCVEMTPMRFFFLPASKGDVELPPLADGQPARDPFDAQLIGSARRTAEGFEFRLYTR